MIDGNGGGKSSLNMNLADYYYRVINWPSRTALLVALAVAIGLLVIAVVILSTDKLRRVRPGLGIVGVVVIMALLWTVREQTVTARKSAHITITTYRYTERSRTALLVGLVALPAVASVVMSSVFVIDSAAGSVSSSRAGSETAAGITPRRNTRPPFASTTRRSRRLPIWPKRYFRRGCALSNNG